MIVLEMAVFALVTSASPGPVNLLASISGAQYKLKKNLAFVSGATAGFCSILIITGFGFGQILETNKMFANLLSIFGSVYMLYLAYTLSKAKIDLNFKAHANSKAPHFLQGALLQYTNPKAWLVSLAGASMYLQGQGIYLSLAIFATIFYVICFLSIYSWVYLGYFLSKKMSSNQLSTYNKFMALVLAVLVSINLYGNVSSLYADLL